MGGLFIKNNTQNHVDEISNLKNEIEKLKDNLKEKEFIVDRTREYLFILENKNELKNRQIDDMKKDNICKINEIVKNKDNQIKTLKRECENRINNVNCEKIIFSIIIPIFNTEKYLSEAIDSVISQSFIFDNVEIILIESGSADNCRKICEEYVSKYPNNIKLIVLDNTPLSFKRNEGLKIAQGKFINFLDSEDKLEPNTLNEVFYLFNKFGEEIDVISMSRLGVDVSEGEMAFYNKYNKSRIVDINEEYDFPIISTNSAFLRKTEAIKFEFNERFIFYEDCNYMTKLILEKGKFGVVDSVKYLYHKPPEENSLDIKNTDKRNFINGIEIHIKSLINYSVEKFGKVLRYVQSVVMYNLQLFFLENTEKEVLNYEEFNQFHNNLHEIFQVIDDDIILSQNFSKFIKSYMLNIKYDYPGYNINLDEDIISLNNGISFDKLSDNKIIIDNLDENSIIGYFKFYSDEINITAYDGEKKLDVVITNIEKEISICKAISYTFNFRINLDEYNGLDNFKFGFVFNSKNYPILFESKINK